MTDGSERSSRRTFLRRALVASATATAVPIAAVAGRADAAEEGPSPYGPLADRDGLGVLLPPGFSVEVVAVSGQQVPGTGYVWRGAPDGAATFGDGAGGWYHTVNHELGAGSGGGVSTLHFDAAGTVIGAWSILSGTSRNCAGGPTPWGTWLSCEEVADGLVWECAPSFPSQGSARPALGVFNHEAVAVDPVGRRLYLTEDRGDGLLYRFTPDTYPNLDSGLLEAANVVGGVVEWVAVPDPSAASTDTRYQLPGAVTTFNGGEGIWHHNGRVYFTTKGDNGVWDLQLASGRLTRIWSGNAGDPGSDQLTGVDNVTVESGSGDVYVAEDGGDMEIVLISPEGFVSPFLQVLGQWGSELTGPVFTPRGDRLMFSSQRGPDGAGITYMVTGPFRGGPGVPVEPTATPTPEPTPTPSATATPAPTATATATPTATAAPTASPTPDDDEAAALLVPTATPTSTPEPSATARPSATPTTEPDDEGSATDAGDSSDDADPGDAEAEPDADGERAEGANAEPSSTPTPDRTAVPTAEARGERETGGSDDARPGAAEEPTTDTESSSGTSSPAEDESSAASSAADAPADAIDLDPATPEPGATFRGIAVERAEDRSTEVALGLGAAIAGAAGAALVRLRRRQEPSGD